MFRWNFGFPDGTDVGSRGDHADLGSTAGFGDHYIENGSGYFDLDGSLYALPTTSTDGGNGATSVVLSIWVRPDVQQANDGLLTTRGTDYIGVAIGASTNDAYFVYQGNAEVTATNVFSTDNWTHVLAQVSASSIEIYADGVLKATNSTVSSSALTVDDHWWVGWDDFSGGRAFDGDVSMPSVYTNTWFSSAQVLSLYNATTNGHSN